MIVSVPASSANLGPGFDALAMALTLPFELATGDSGREQAASGPRWLDADERHPATVAFRRRGGTGALRVRSSIPPGRGLGYSGAARVAGLVAACAQRDGRDLDLREVSAEVLAAATELEGHADNAAASLFGGVVATAAGRAVQVPMAFDPAVVVWIPDFTTSTDESRASIGSQVALDDVVFNIGRTALLVAALAAGDVASLAVATQDRLHQDRRLAKALPSRDALAALLGSGAWGAWLSGSGPTVAALCALEHAPVLVNACPPGGRNLVLRIDHTGATVHED